MAMGQGDNVTTRRFFRGYEALAREISPGLDRAAAMAAFCDAAWKHLSAAGVSWIGFYVHEGGDELILAARRDKPACSPIGLHGACGRAFREKRPLIVRDVAALGASYIACDPRDRSEVVLPVIDASGNCWSVLDVDSHHVGAFDASDVDALGELLEKSGLSTKVCHSTMAIVV